MQSPTGKQHRNDVTKTSNFNTSQQYIPGLKHNDYTRPTNNNIDPGYLPRNTKITGSRLGQRVDDPNKSNSRIQYSPSPGVIVHQYPSRPVRSPSPAFRNPNANVIPPANFIYNSPGSNQSSRVVNLSPPKIIRGEPQIVMPNPQPRMVPAALYQSCAQQCKVWQQKYNELYNTFLKTQSELANLSRQPKQYSIPIPDRETGCFGVQREEYEHMMKQNKKLRERVKQLERNQQKMTYNMEDVITRLVNKYRESTLKESMLLVDRYRLEKKMAQKI